MTKDNIKTVKDTINGFINLTLKLKNIDDENLLQESFVKIQEKVISLGEFLEKQKNPQDERQIVRLNLIGKLEAICEILYEFSLHKCNDERDFSSLADAFEEILKNMSDIVVTYRVAFLPYKAAMWDSLESVWQEFAQDERFETSVVAIPYYVANRISGEWEFNYDGDIFPDYVPVVNYEQYDLSVMKPDLVFVHNPFDEFNNVTSVNPIYYSAELKKHCGKLIYLPYYVNAGILTEGYVNLPLLRRADYIVLQSERMKEGCRDYPYYDRILPYGSPKFDKIISCMKDAEFPKEWDIKEDMASKKRLLLNTTISDLLRNNSKLIAKLKAFFALVKDRDDVIIVWRPHPLLEATLKSMRTELYEDYLSLINFFLDNGVGIMDKTGDVAKAIAACDAYIGSSYSSMIALFEAANKPIYAFDSENYMMENSAAEKLLMENSAAEKPATEGNFDEIFYKNGEFGFFMSRESDGYRFEDFLEDLVLGRLEKIKEKEAIAAHEMNASPMGDCGRKVYEHLSGEILDEA